MHVPGQSGRTVLKVVHCSITTPVLLSVFLFLVRRPCTIFAVPEWFFFLRPGTQEDTHSCWDRVCELKRSQHTSPEMDAISNFEKLQDLHQAVTGAAHIQNFCQMFELIYELTVGVVGSLGLSQSIKVRVPFIKVNESCFCGTIIVGERELALLQKMKESSFFLALAGCSGEQSFVCN